MATEVKRLIRVRVEKGASFKRDGYGKKRQLSDSWRKPRGQHNKQREQKKAKGALPKPGFGSPVAVRGMHPSGFFEVLVATLKELEVIDPKTQAVRIAATVGDRKRVALQEAAIAKGLKVLNARAVKVKATKAPVKKADAKDAGKEKAEKKPATSKAAPAKKAAAKPKAESSEKTEKKAPAKKAAAKPKAESSEKTEKKAPAKKAAAKPKAESSEKTEKKAPAKKAAAKTTKSGVKKNE
jgi:large subunit ribosomal protein L32e